MKAPFLKSALLIAGISFLVSCQKDVSELSSLASKNTIEHPIKSHSIKGEFSGLGSIVWLDNYVPLYYLGKAEGWANGLGKFTSLFIVHMVPNQFVSITESALFKDGLKGDLRFMENRISELGQVSVISYDKQGNSIWGKIIWSKDEPVDQNTMKSEANYDIVGGTGKYEGASGQYTLSGFYKIPSQEPAPLSFTISGRIIYKDID